MSNPFLRFARGAAPAIAITALEKPSTTVASSVDAALSRKRKLIKEEPFETSSPPVHLDVKSENVTTSGTHEDDDAPLNRRVEQLRNLVEMRSAGPQAPIDMYGTQACVFSSTASDATKRFQILVAALLSSQTQDGITHAAMQRLHTQLEEPMTGDSSIEAAEKNDGLTIAKIRAATVERIQEVLVPVGFYRRKAQQLKQVADTLHAVYRGDIPRRLDDLLALPGIGPKIARVILLLAWDDVDEGLIVDTHVHRVSNRLRWVGEANTETKTPEQTREALQEWVPREYWRDFSLNVVGFGQLTCTAVHPKCGSCPLAPTCASAFKCIHPATKKSNAKRAKLAEIEEQTAVQRVRYEEDDDFV